MGRGGRASRPVLGLPKEARVHLQQGWTEGQGELHSLQVRFFLARGSSLFCVRARGVSLPVSLTLVV